MSAEKFTFFFGIESPFSQWHPCRFEIDGVTFACAEQSMMYGKERCCSAIRAVADEILTAAHPKQDKALGRKVKPYDEHAWRANRERIVMAGSRAKFTQDAALRAALVATAGTTLVEASPYDKIWGIGLGATDPRAADRAQWKGAKTCSARS